LETDNQNFSINLEDEFLFSLNSNIKIKLSVNIKSDLDIKHDKKIVPPVRCFGTNRTKQAREILLKSISIVQTENYLMNLININPHGKLNSY
jgi:hypothetical protein